MTPVSPLRLVVVDDHSLFRRGLIQILADIPEIQVVGEAADGIQALRVIQETNPDVVLLDVNMPHMDGVEVVRTLRTAKQPVRILMLTISKNDEDLLGAIRAGADGYLLKNTDPEDFQRALIHIAKGEGVLSPEVTRTVLKALKRSAEDDSHALMSEREVQILECLAQGQTTQQIASQLFISENTVKTHVRHILEKLQAANRTEAVGKAIQLGLIQRTS